MTTSYSLANNRITITGGTEAIPYIFTDDQYAADLAGSLELMAATTPALNMTLSQQVRPAQQLALKIDFVIAGATIGAGDTIDITGTDAWGDALSETLITESNGTFTTTNRFATNTNIDCNGFSDGTLTVNQNQWGVWWKLSDYEYRCTAQVLVGGGVETWVKDSMKTITWDMTGWTSGTMIDANYSNAHVQFGELISESEKTTEKGILFNAITPSTSFVYSINGKNLKFYSCSFLKTGLRAFAATWIYFRTGGDVGSRCWNTNLGDISLGDTQNVNLYNLTSTYANYFALRPAATSTIEKISVNNPRVGLVSFKNVVGTLKDIWLRNLGTKWIASLHSTLPVDAACSMIDIDYPDIWIIQYIAGLHAGVKLYRQYTYNLKIILEKFNISDEEIPIENAYVTLWQKDGSSAFVPGDIFFQGYTNAGGNLAVNQLLTLGYYNQAGGNTINRDYHKIMIQKKGFEKIEIEFTPDKTTLEWKHELVRSKICYDQGVI